MGLTTSDLVRRLVFPQVADLLVSNAAEAARELSESPEEAAACFESLEPEKSVA